MFLMGPTFLDDPVCISTAQCGGGGGGNRPSGGPYTGHGRAYIGHMIVAW